MIFSLLNTTQKVRYRAIYYLFFFSLPFIFISTYFYKEPRSEIIHKTRQYKKVAQDYNLIFLGDSRTYVGIHPEFIDEILHTKSANLAQYMHWFPTQYPQYEDIIDLIPENTTVVWSIGSQNFHKVGDYRWAKWSIYFIGYKNVFKYISMGFPVKTISRHLWNSSSNSYLLENAKKPITSSWTL